MEPIRLGSLTLYPFGLLFALFALGALVLIARSMNKADGKATAPAAPRRFVNPEAK